MKCSNFNLELWRAYWKYWTITWPS